MDAFKSHRSKVVDETSTRELSHQCRGRALEEREIALADAMMQIFSTGEHNFSDVAKRLAEMEVVAPLSGRTDWTESLLATELETINRQLDAAYAASGYGA